MTLLHRCRAWLPLAAALLAAWTRAPAAAAQPAPPAGWTMVVEDTHRWMHGRQRDAFAPGGGEEAQIAIDSVRRDPARGERTLFIRMDTAAFVTHDARGRNLRIQAPVEQRRVPGESALDAATAIGGRAMDRGGDLLLPAARLWDMVPGLPAGALRTGLRWTEPVDRRAESGPYAQSLRGRRVSTVVRDTMVEGRRMWIVRDSAAVRYEERWIRMERTLATAVGVERGADGVLLGRHLYDPALGLFRHRTDTARYAGEAVLRYPDGRRFRTPARYERTRVWTLYDSAGLARREEEVMNAESARRSGGMLDFPATEVEQRLSDGDTALRDSLVAVWQRSPDSEERNAAFRALRGYAGGAGPNLAQLALQAGDTVFYLNSVLDGFYSVSRGPVNAEELARLLPVMDDPGLAFAFGIDLDPLYENPRQDLLTDPPAVQPDSTRWACTRAACELLMAQYDQAREPRLRALGLIARLAFDPARWGPTVLREGVGNPYLADAVMAVRGVAATWPAAAHAPVPKVGADWRAWLEWMDGRNPAYANNPALRPPGVRWEAAHRTALHFQQALTGRRIVEELHARFAEAESDSARLVFGSILLGMNETIHTPAQIAQLVRSLSAADRELGIRQLPALFEHAVLADSATAEALVERVLAIQIDDAQPWRDLDGGTMRPWHIVRGEGPLPLMLRRDSLPPEVARRWGARARLLTAAELDALSREPGIRIRVPPPVVVGPFARVTLWFSSRYPGAPDEEPAGSAGLWDVWLLSTPGGWVMVQQGGSIT